METENKYTIHSHIHQYAPQITVRHRRSLLAERDSRFHGRNSEVIFGEGKTAHLMTRTDRPTALAVSRILCIGLAPTPTLCDLFAWLLSSS